MALDLSVEEFALIYKLMYHGLNGHNSLRTSFETDMAEAYAELHPAWRSRIQNVLDSRELVAFAVANEFGSE